MNVVIVMGLNVFFACNVRCKEPMDGQRGFGFRVKYKNDCILKMGQCARYGGGRGGGFCRRNKRFWQTPLSIADEKGVMFVFLKIL